MDIADSEIDRLVAQCYARSLSNVRTRNEEVANCCVGKSQLLPLLVVNVL